MMAIVALYSRIRFASSSRRSFSSLSRSAPTEAGDAAGTASLRIARTASFGCFARAKALASASVTGPVSAAIALMRALARAVFLAFLRFAGVAIRSPSLDSAQSRCSWQYPSRKATEWAKSVGPRLIAGFELRAKKVRDVPEGPQR
jgi:hypothetical protein